MKYSVQVVSTHTVQVDAASTEEAISLALEAEVSEDEIFTTSFGTSAGKVVVHD
jgi:hypothetical protein